MLALVFLVPYVSRRLNHIDSVLTVQGNLVYTASTLTSQACFKMADRNAAPLFSTGAEDCCQIHG